MRTRASILVALLLAACTGEIGSGADDGSLPPGSDDGANPSQVAGFTYVSRLHPRAYANTLQSLLGVAPASDPPGEAAPSDAYDTSSEAFTVSDAMIEQYLALAESAAAAVDVTSLSGCNVAASGEAACVAAFLDRVGTRGFRRPLDDEERAAYTALFEAMRVDDDYATSLRVVLTRILMSPDFLYRVELGLGPEPDGSSPRLTAYEMASRLSYLLWEDMPDDDLFAAAAADTLATAEGIAAQVPRMLERDATRETTWSFHRQWLSLDELDTIYKAVDLHPDFEADRAAYAEESRLFFDNVVWNEGATLATVLRAPYTWANDRVGAAYGISVPTADFVRVELDPAQRAGVLTQPAFLSVFSKAAKSAPILRGVYVMRRVLCAPPAPPPPDAATIPPDAPPAATTRQFFENLTAAESCAGCHRQINPVGFLFEHFDEVGRFRQTENGVDVDASGAAWIDDRLTPLPDAVALAEALAGSQAVARCFVRQGFRYGYRRADVAADTEAIDAIAGRFGPDVSVRELLGAMTTPEAFRRLHYSTRALEEP